jgi:TetR/AcrR family transcriptional regulator, repressor for uid operon
MAAEPVTLIARALEGGVEPPDDAVSEKILDAALELAAASGIRHLTMDDVARRAGVGRMTVYRRFGDKVRLVEALTIREGRRCLAELDAAARPDQPIADQVAEGFVTSLRLAREHPLLHRLARIEPESVLRALTADGSALFAIARAFVAGRLRESQKAGTLARDVAVDEAAELLIRISFSFALIEESALPLDDEDKARDVARRLIVPMLT